MRAVVCHATDQPLAIEHRPLPEPGAGEVLVRVRRCGICGSELHIADQSPRTFPGGLVFGHEYAGEVARLGPGVEGMAEGDLVALYPALGCGDCAACQRGNEILCPSARRLLGGYAEYACLPARCAIHLPAGHSAADGALVEPLAVSFYGVKAAQLQAEERVLVLGAGSIALGAIFWARRQGAGRIAAMSRSARRKDLALEFGADAFIAYSDNDAAEVCKVLGGMPDIIIECTGSAGMLARAIGLAPTFGRVISLGLCNTPETIVPVAAGMKDLILRFPVGYSRDDFSRVASTMLDGHVDPKRMISRVASIDETPAVFAHMLAGHGETKVQIMP